MMRAQVMTIIKGPIFFFAFVFVTEHFLKRACFILQFIKTSPFAYISTSLKALSWVRMVSSIC